MPNRTTLARCISVVGHPLAMLALALLALQVDRATGRDVAILLGALVACAMLVIGFTRRQVRSGRWRHVDASGVDERRRLNRFLLGTLLAGTLLASATGTAPDVVAVLALAASIVVAALIASRMCKLSLHVAFAVFAALVIARAAWWAGALLLGVAAVVAWSRLALARHVPRDLVAGALAGLAAGAAFLLVAPTWQA